VYSRDIMNAVDGSLPDALRRVCTGYAEVDIPDFTQYTMEQVDEWIDVCNFCCLSYATDDILINIKHATAEQIVDTKWIDENTTLVGDKTPEYQGNLKFWKKVWTFLNVPNLTWKKFKEVEHDTDVFIFCDDERITIVWRGTESIEDVIIDVEFGFVKWPHGNNVKGKVHYGFLGAYDAVRNQIRTECEKLIMERNITQIDITGHSLGASVATFNCLDFTLNPLKGAVPIHAIVVALPSSGDHEFTEYFSTVFPTLKAISNKVDPILNGEMWKPCGTKVFLKVSSKYGIIASHKIQTYLKYAEESKQYIQENQIQLKASISALDSKKRFNFHL